MSEANHTRRVSVAAVRPSPGDTSWFVHDRFGMFIHWGLYALPARHEWVKNKEEIPDEVYQRYFDRFDPDLYDPAVWADAAAGAGMRYFVVTTKHHEGFCLWDSALTDYKATRTPYGKDLLHPMVDAFRSRGMRVGFYHSLIDWHHPDFVIDDVHSERNHPEREAMNRTRDQGRYIRYLHGQVRELLTQFGRVDVLWCDFSYPGRGKGRDEWDSPRLYRTIRELQPQVLLNDRMDLDDGWDIKTPEQWQPQGWIEVDGMPVTWEACQTFSGSWGYHRDESSWKSVGQLIRMLCDTVSKGGNLLLNVGPTGRGELDQRALERLRGNGRVDEPPRALHLRLHAGAGRVRSPAGLPAHLESRDPPAVRPRVRVAVPPTPPARLPRQGGLRPVAERRVGGGDHRDVRAPGADGARRRGRPDPGAAGPAAAGGGAGDRALSGRRVVECAACSS